MITKTRSNFLHITTVLVLGMALSSLVAPRAAAQKTPPGPSDVHVVNTAADPVPVKIDPATNAVKIDGAANTVKIDGATNIVKIDGIANTVKAGQSGNWGVSILGTPNVTLSGSSTVQIGNPATAPALVRDVDRASAQPVLEILSATFNDGFSATTTFTNTYNVPSNKRLVIEFVTVLTTLPSGQTALFATLTTPGREQYLSLTTVGNVSVGTHKMFVLLEPGTLVKAFGQRIGGTGTGTVTMTISGYLVDL